MARLQGRPRVHQPLSWLLHTELNIPLATRAPNLLIDSMNPCSQSFMSGSGKPRGACKPAPLQQPPLRSAAFASPRRHPAQRQTAAVWDRRPGCPCQPHRSPGQPCPPDRHAPVRFGRRARQAFLGPDGKGDGGCPIRRDACVDTGGKQNIIIVIKYYI